MITRTKKAKIIREQLESKFKKLRNIDSVAPKNGWCASIREALGMSAIDLAGKMGIDVSTLYRLEESESKGKVNLETLNKMAKALEAEVKYVIVPKKSLDEMIKDAALAYALDDIKKVSHSMALEDQKASDDFNKKEYLESAKKLVEVLDSKIWKKR